MSAGGKASAGSEVRRRITSPPQDCAGLAACRASCILQQALVLGRHLFWGPCADNGRSISGVAALMPSWISNVHLASCSA